MEKSKGNRGGRPKVSAKRDQHLAVKCSLLERRLIERRAKGLGLTVSVYLRELGLDGQVEHRVRALPREVLLLTGTLHHIAAQLSQLVDRRNQRDGIRSLEHTPLGQLVEDLATLVVQIKKFVQ
jgi:hypothetical protein